MDEKLKLVIVVILFLVSIGLWVGKLMGLMVIVLILMLVVWVKIGNCVYVLLGGGVFRMEFLRLVGVLMFSDL